MTEQAPGSERKHIKKAMEIEDILNHHSLDEDLAAAMFVTTLWSAKSDVSRAIGAAKKLLHDGKKPNLDVQKLEEEYDELMTEIVLLKESKEAILDIEVTADYVDDIYEFVKKQTALLARKGYSVVFEELSDPYYHLYHQNIANRQGDYDDLPGYDDVHGLEPSYGHIGGDEMQKVDDDYEGEEPSRCFKIVVKAE